MNCFLLDIVQTKIIEDKAEFFFFILLFQILWNLHVPELRSSLHVQCFQHGHVVYGTVQKSLLPGGQDWKIWHLLQV